jgi:hypothetical protein
VVDIDRLNQVQRILAKRYRDIIGSGELFDIKTDNPPDGKHLADAAGDGLKACKTDIPPLGNHIGVAQRETARQGFFSALGTVKTLSDTKISHRS